MNSNYGKGSSGSLNNFQFDLGLGSNRPKSLNDQKNQSSSYASYSSSSSFHSTTQPKPAWQPNKPSWTHQPAPSTRPAVASGSASMVGDIYGKSWTSSAPSSSASSVGIVDKNPNLFGDLLSSALGQGKSSSNVPLKSAIPASASMGSNKSPYSMGNLADSLPKTSNSAKSVGGWGSENFGSFTGGYNSTSTNANVNVSSNRSPNPGGPSMKSMAGGGGGSGMGANKDPFGSLVDFSSKKSGGLNSSSKFNEVKVENDVFGDFQNASKSSTATFPSSGFSSNGNSFMGSNITSDSKLDDFGMPTKDFTSHSQPSGQSSGSDPFSMFFSSTSASAGGAATASGGAGEQQFSAVDDWGLGSEFGGGGDYSVGGGDSVGTTTEIEGLPAPPAGVTASAAKNKGIDNQKQGQYADAIKWLSWAVILMEKIGDKAGSIEVLSCRASCYKEVGEYKKAVADCTKASVRHQYQRETSS